MAKQTQKPVRVGIVGEDDEDHDYNAIRVLLEKQYGALIQCVQLGRRLKGDKLATKNRKACVILQADFAKTKRPDIVVYSRDLDSGPTDAAKQRERQQEFDRFNAEAFEQRGMLLLHIFELEALIMADIAAFNQRYNVSYRLPQADTMRIVDPKGKLKAATGHRYHESEAALVFANANYSLLLAGCSYFREFNDAFAARLAASRRRP